MPDFKTLVTYDGENVIQPHMRALDAVVDPTLDDADEIIVDHDGEVLRSPISVLKATINAVLLAGAQTVGGVKDFTDGIKIAAGSILDHYSFGAWPTAPVVGASSVAQPTVTSYTIQTSFYVRIGPIVFFTFFLRTAGYAVNGSSGEFLVKNLPYTPTLSNVNITSFPAVTNNVTWPGTPISAQAEVPAGNPVVRFFSMQSAGLRQYVAPSAVSAVSDINATGFYFV